LLKKVKPLVVGASPRNLTDSRAFDSNADVPIEVTDAGISNETSELPENAHSSIVVTVFAITTEVID